MGEGVGREGERQSVLNRKLFFAAIRPLKQSVLTTNEDNYTDAGSVVQAIKLTHFRWCVNITANDNKP